jgi:DNA-binding NtrC family response regulator
MTEAGGEKIIVVEDDPSVRTTIVTFLEIEGFAVEAFSNTRDAIERLSHGGCRLVISDIYVDDKTGIDILQAAKKQDPDCAVILMTARGTIETVMAATRGGAGAVSLRSRGLRHHPAHAARKRIIRFRPRRVYRRGPRSDRCIGGG